jgi:UDP-glucose 4-epimerase
MGKAKVLITGIAGLLGANFSRYLLSKGYDVIGIDDLSGGYESNVPEGCTFYKANLIQEDEIQKIFEGEKPDYVYHFAAYAAVCLSPFIRNYNYQNNVVCSANAINACINNSVKKIIFSSSMDVYGEQEPPFTEKMIPQPTDPYGIAKYAIELDLHAANKQFGLRYSIIRPHNVAGVYQNIWDRYRNVIGIWIRKTLASEPITIYGDGSQIRSFSDIAFYMEPFEKLMSDHDSETFNIGADQHCTINELADTFEKVANDLGYESNRVYLEKRQEVHTAYCDHAKANDLLDFCDNTNLEKTISSMFKWAVTQPRHSSGYMNYEIEKGMYSFWKKD